MSNDTKLWVWRGVLLACLLINSWALFRWLGGLSGSAGSSFTAFWAALFIITTIGLLVGYIYYRKAKAERWENSGHKSSEQIEVETLAAYARQQQAAAERGVTTNPAPVNKPATSQTSAAAPAAADKPDPKPPAA